MQNEQQLVAFLREDLFQALNGLHTDTAPVWGKMNAHQMLDHLVAIFHNASGQLVLPLETPTDLLPRYRDFLHSDKMLRENTKAPVSLVPEEPADPKSGSLAEAKDLLKLAVDDFFAAFNNNLTLKTTHPVFGELNYYDWLVLHNKHMKHHLRQFGLLSIN
jgi:hypothetical protein